MAKFSELVYLLFLVTRSLVATLEKEDGPDCSTQRSPTMIGKALGSSLHCHPSFVIQESHNPPRKMGEGSSCHLAWSVSSSLSWRSGGSMYCPFNQKSGHPPEQCIPFRKIFNEWQGRCSSKKANHFDLSTLKTNSLLRVGHLKEPFMIVSITRLWHYNPSTLRVHIKFTVRSLCYHWVVTCNSLRLPFEEKITKIHKRPITQIQFYLV